MSDLEELKWLSPDDPELELRGLAWWATEGKFRRLPVTAPGEIREVLDDLANHTAGAQLRFQTNASKLVVKVRLAGKNEAEHMAATGVNGIDCYLGVPGEQLYYGTTRFPHDSDGYESVLYESLDPEMRCVTLNLPLFQGLLELRIGVNPDAGFKSFPPYEEDGRIILYGTSITQGGCASRPGMAYSNILSRRFNLEFVNLGFSGNGQGDPEIARFIAAIERPRCLVLDYDANCPDLAMLAGTMPGFIRIFRERHPDVPLLVVSRIPYGYEHTRTVSRQERLEKRDFQSGLVKELREAGDERIFFCDGADLLGDAWNECTVDGVHPTDLGFLRIADGLTPVLKEILRNS